MATSDELHGEACYDQTPYIVAAHANSFLSLQVPFHQAHMGGMLSSDQKAFGDAPAATTALCGSQADRSCTFWASLTS